MSKQQTAVEFLIKAFQGAYGEKVINVISVQVEQAKQMEKEQIVDAYKADLHPCSDEDAEQYYNETYNKD
jgi:RNA binding exosome subunit